MKDKIYHFLAGFIIAIISMGIVKLGEPTTLLIVAVVAIGKELFDLYIRKTSFNWWDVLATILGSILLFIFTI